MATSTAQPRFPERYWEPQWRRYLLVPEFLRQRWEDISLPPVPDATKTRQELDHLLQLKESGERAKRLDDIKAQMDRPQDTFTSVMMFGPASHPRTCELVELAMSLGAIVVMHFKHKHQRPRPAQLDFGIQPALRTPPHASWPSGHSTQTHLIAHILAELIPAQKDGIFALALDIARNRERAGLHYPSDTEAGQALARRMFAILKDRAKCPKFAEVLAEARREWS